MKTIFIYQYGTQIFTEKGTIDKEFHHENSDEYTIRTLTKILIIRGRGLIIIEETTK